MPLFQHRFQGHLAPGDIFVFSWWSDNSLTLATSHGNAVTWANDFMDGAAGDNGYAQYCTPEVGIDRISTGEIDVATGQQQTLADSTVDLTGASADGAMQPETALVVSLRTSQANRSGRGRFYLPQPSTNSATSTGRLDSTAQTDIADALFFAWDNAVSAGEVPVVYSRELRSTITITTFNVGDVYDVQRRRSNSLVESRTSNNMP